jgi:hypothetical protein
MSDEQERRTEVDIACERVGPQDVPDQPDQRRVTKKEKEQLPKNGEFDGHVA